MFSQLRHLSTIGKHFLNSNISSTCPYKKVNFGPLTAESEIYWGSLGHPAYFSGFRLLASLLHRRRSTEVNQALHNIWPSPGLVHYIYIFGALNPNFAKCKIHFAAKFCVLLYWQQHYCTALEQWASAKLRLVQGSC